MLFRQILLGVKKIRRDRYQPTIKLYYVEKSWIAEVEDESEDKYTDSHSKNITDTNGPDEPSDAESDGACSGDNHQSGDDSDHDENDEDGSGSCSGKGKGGSKSKGGKGGSAGNDGRRGAMVQEQALEACSASYLFMPTCLG